MPLLPHSSDKSTLNHLPEDILISMMMQLSFKESLSLSSTFKTDHLNPLKRKFLNPLTYHNPELDNNYAQRNLMNADPKDRLFYAQRLMENQALDLGFNDYLLLKKAVAAGDVDLFDLILKKTHIDDSILQKALFSAIDKGHVKLFEYLIEHGVKPIPKALYFASNVDIFKRLMVDFDFRPTDRMLTAAAEKGNVDLVDFLIRYGLNPKKKDWEIFIERGDLAMIKEFGKRMLFPDIHSLLFAAKENKTDIVKYLLSQNYPRTDLIFLRHRLLEENTWKSLSDEIKEMAQMNSKAATGYIKKRKHLRKELVI